MSHSWSSCWVANVGRGSHKYHQAPLQVLLLVPIVLIETHLSIELPSRGGKQDEQPQILKHDYIVERNKGHRVVGFNCTAIKAVPCEHQRLHMLDYLGELLPVHKHVAIRQIPRSCKVC